jgi:ATP-dependent DNA helicase RecG
MSLRPSDPLTSVRGVGPAVNRALAGAGVATVLDLLWVLPYRWEDRANPRRIDSLLHPETAVTVAGRLTHLVERRARNRRLRIVEGVVDDGSGALPVVWFNQPYIASSLHRGDRLWLHGPVRPARSGWGVQMVAPEWEVEEADAEPIHLGRVVPMYRRLGSLTGRRLRTLLARVLSSVELPPDPLADVVAPLGLPSLGEALQQLHFPPPPEGDAAVAGTLDLLARRVSPPHRRLAFEELLDLAIVLERERERRAQQHAQAFTITEELRERARAVLPFVLTNAQRRVVGEIVADLQKPIPMARLLQGDVGSGKTIVATLAAVVAMEGGAQVAFLAPTELLAQQHFRTLAALLASTPHRPHLLIGSLPAGEKAEVRGRLAAGEALLVVGTHALLEETTAFQRLGFAIVDEQHRFGAAQRQALLAKGEAPHLLVMTATPIPRSLALSVYGDLDVSILDELPPGRTPVRTLMRGDETRPKLFEFLRQEAAAGGQVYWVFPLIEESQRLAVRAVESHTRAVREGLRGLTIGVVHGRLAAEERDRVMVAFASGEIAVLCSTTVIEVGVDVPAASVMVIENAERFGLAQLHQLRGRVGRGRRRSLCVLLVGEDASPEARERLDLFASVSDGFRIAEEDLRLRGPGELAGLRQWGRPAFAVASLTTHQAELEAARAVAAAARAEGRLDELAGKVRGAAQSAAVPPG